jgi:hypothetical protein
MGVWTEQGERLVNDVANRYGATHDAVSMMLEAILRGNGTMAQFNIYELGGSGQWMRGGMTMVGDMFNYQLKSKVDGICGELSSAIVEQNLQVVPPPPPQKPGMPSQNSWGQWWPAELGSPNTSGSQNQYRYAYFANMHRLAISDGMNVTIYNTLDHNIGGVSQQQGGVAGVGFTSQYGNVDLRTLPLVSGIAVGTPTEPTIPVTPLASTDTPVFATAQETVVSNPPIQVVQGNYNSDDLFSMIEKLAKLRDTGALTEDEYVAKKTELLARL